MPDQKQQSRLRVKTPVSLQAIPVRHGQPSAASAQARTALLALVGFLLGIGVGALWYFRMTQRPPATETRLTESTRALLRSLNVPVEIRFYSLLDPATVPDSLPAFAQRVDELLSEYEQAGGDKIRLIRRTNRSDTAEAAAAADGVKAFNLDKGDACFLGVILTHQDQKETLAQLSPEWDAALEADLSRAIARVAAPKARVTMPVATAPTDPAIIEEVKRVVTNLALVSLAEGTQALRAAALQEFREATREMELRVKEAEQRIGQLPPQATETERQTAVKHLQQVQAEQTEKLKQIAARLQERIATLQTLKPE